MPRTRAGARSPKIDQYIAKLPEFSKEITTVLREIIHQADPKIVESWKWGPHFSDHGMVVGFGAFKKWVTLTFFEGALLADDKKLFNYGESNLHNRSIKFTDVVEVMEIRRQLIAYIQEAVANNLKGKKTAPSTTPKSKQFIPPKAFVAALKKTHLEKLFHTRPPYQRRGYVLWVYLEPKQKETREKRFRVMERELKLGSGYMGLPWSG